MENKINIAELLKDCPQGMELDCLIFEGVTLYSIDTDIDNEHPIRIVTNGYFFDLTKYGTYSNIAEAKCVIFPKGKTTWEGFVPPYHFKDGDVIYFITENDNEYIFIFKNNTDNYIEAYVDFAIITSKCSLDTLFYNDNIKKQRLATEKEKQKLFDAIKANGYKWNEETKTLEKLVKPKFKVGDVIQDIDTYKVKITEVSIEDECYEYESMDIKRIGSIGFSEQDNWELVPNKFDITTLKPFDKVLVRDSDETWCINLFGCYNKTDNQYNCIGNTDIGWDECIPYEGNEHLLGKIDDCDEYYKTWE